MRNASFHRTADLDQPHTRIEPRRHVGRRVAATAVQQRLLHAGLDQLARGQHQERQHAG
jgi:hypothetical protein